MSNLIIHLKNEEINLCNWKDDLEFKNSKRINIMGQFFEVDVLNLTLTEQYFLKFWVNGVEHTTIDLWFNGKKAHFIYFDSMQEAKDVADNFIKTKFVKMYNLQVFS